MVPPAEDGEAIAELQDGDEVVRDVEQRGARARG